MIITKTPYRISFFGGGSDYPEWYNFNAGKVLSTTIDKYIYISCRDLPPFFEHKYRIVWSQMENVKNINQIKHKAVKEMLKYFKIKNGLEIHYDGDLPARSGMGSSSVFVVGLMNLLNNFLGTKINKQKLAQKSIYFEQKILKESVGSQDQIAASFGGFNKIFFKKNSFKVKRIKETDNLIKLNNNLVLMYSGIQRTAHKIADSYVSKLRKKKETIIRKIISYVDEGEKILSHGNVDDFGKLLHESWVYKKELSKNISNKKIDNLYNEAIRYGALGGKLLGAGGGGFLLLYVKKENQIKFFKKFNNIVHIPFKFSNNGSKVIFNKT